MFSESTGALRSISFLDGNFKTYYHVNQAAAKRQKPGSPCIWVIGQTAVCGKPAI
jgi:hypothetical protein